MTKQEELATLREAASRLGPDSYLGPWLLENIPAIERDIQGDILPSPTWRQLDARAEECSKQCSSLVARAQAEAASIIFSANKQAEERLSEAYRRINDCSRSLARLIQ